MLLKYIKRFIDSGAFKEDLRKIGINFITAGIVGIFINHYVGYKLSAMFWASAGITCMGILSMALGLSKLRGKK